MLKNKQTKSREMNPEPSKDRAMHEEHKPSFWNEFMQFDVFMTVYIYISTKVVCYWAVETPRDL
jgi:hypothetical protein